MSFSSSISVKHSIRSNRKTTVATDGYPLQFVQFRLRSYRKLVSLHSDQTILRSPPTLISDDLFQFPLRELEHPPYLSKFFLLRLLSPFNLHPSATDAIFDKIVTFAFELTGGNLNLNFHIINTVDLVYTHWVNPDPALVVPEDSRAAVKGAPAWVMERVMKEKYDGNGREEVGDECIVCCEQLHGEEELSRIGCGHVYHKSCILKWLNINNSCPLCRKELKE